MATSKTVVAAEFKFESDDAKKRVSEIKKELSEAKNQVLALSKEFGDTSIQAINAAKNVAKLKSEIEDASNLSNTFNPSKTFNTLSRAVEGVISGFEVYKGSLSLIGVESEASEKVIEKLNAAMALKDGITGVRESIKDFQILGKELMQVGIVQKAVTAGQWLWNAAMAANPIGAIVAVVAALVAGIVALTAWLIKSSDAAKQNAKEIKESGKALEEQKKSADKSADALKRNTDYTLEMLKASGATTAEIRKAEQALAAKAVVEARTAFQVAAHTREIESQRLAQMKANGATEENIKAQTENLNKYTENLNEQGKRLTAAKQSELDLIAKHNVQIRQEQTDENKAELDANKEKHDKLLQQQKDFQEKQKQLRLQLNDEINKLTLSEKQYGLLQLENEYQERLKTAKGNEDLLKLVREDYALKLRQFNIDNNIIEKEEVKTNTNEKSKIVIDGAKLTSAGLQQAAQQTTDFLKTDNEIRLKLNESEIEGALAVADTLGNLAKLIGEQTAVGKALSVAQAVISTIVGAQKAYESAQSLPFGIGAVIGPINAGIAIATGVANVRKILAVKVPGPGGGGGGGTPNIGGIQSAQAPRITPQVQTTRLDQAQVNQIGNAAARAYVVESDISNGQERINRLNRAARIN